MNSALIVHFAAALFAIMNPVGCLPLFVSATKSEQAGVRRYVAVFLTLFITAMLLLFYWSGQAVLNFFGVPLSSFQIAGGLILLLNGISMVSGDDHSKITAMATKVATRSDLETAESDFRNLLIPLGMPIFVGPGSISTVILFSGKAETLQDNLGMSLVIVGIALVTLLTLLLSKPVTRILGDMGLDIAARLMGLILAAMGVNFVIEGIATVTGADWSLH